jgi:hypothetical protein
MVTCHKGMTFTVKWDNNLMDNINIAQGIRQGAKLSTLLYKRYNNTILNSLCGWLQFFQDLVLQDLVLCCTVQHQSWLAFQYLVQAEQYHLHMLGRQHLCLQIIMFSKLYQDGVEGDMWSLMNNMYKGMTFKVKWTFWRMY